VRENCPGQDFETQRAQYYTVGVGDENLIKQRENHWGDGSKATSLIDFPYE
jgi:hypothetical protein